MKNVITKHMNVSMDVKNGLKELEKGINVRQDKLEEGRKRNAKERFQRNFEKRSDIKQQEAGGIKLS